MRALSYEDLSVPVGSRLSLYSPNAGHCHTEGEVVLFMEVSFSGWDPAKFAHGCILTDIEDGMYGWLDRYRLSESRRHGIQFTQTELNQEQASARHDPSPPSLLVTRNTRGVASNNFVKKGGDKNSDKKTIRICSYYNVQKCKFDSNHEWGDIFSLPVGSKCKNPGHVDTDCSFLRK
jgi:hypothetical protein